SVVGSAVVSAWYTVPASGALPFWPTPLVRLPCGSTSTSKIRCSPSASDAARLMVVVVLPTPPFWLATATMREDIVFWRKPYRARLGRRAERAYETRSHASTTLCSTCSAGNTQHGQYGCALRDE